MRNARNQLNKVRPGTFQQDKTDNLPAWDANRNFPTYEDGRGSIWRLERHGVFFSHPVDLDLMMLEEYPDAYNVKPTDPDEKIIVAVLGKNHKNEKHLPGNCLRLFDDYHRKFDLASKPATHLGALADLSDEELLNDLPEVLDRLVEYVRESLAGLPE